MVSSRFPSLLIDGAPDLFPFPEKRSILSPRESGSIAFYDTEVNVTPEDSYADEYP